MSSTAKPLQVVQNPETIDNPILDFFLGIWRAKRQGRAMPNRASISLRDIKAHAGWVCILDVLADDFRYRLVGSHVAEYFGGDGTGKTVAEAFAEAGPKIREGVLWIYRKTVDEALPLRVSGPGGKIGGRYYPDYDALYLPLADDGEKANMLLAVFTFNYEEYRRTRSSHVLTRAY